MMKNIPTLLATVTLATLAGCASLPAWLEGEQNHPLFTPVNYRGDAQLSADIQRVAFLPIHGGDIASPEATTVMDTVLLTALQRQVRFEVVVVSREDCQRLFGAGDYASTAALPHGFLEKIAEKYAVDEIGRAHV